jgi:hypothetical protein
MFNVKSPFQKKTVDNGFVLQGTAMNWYKRTEVSNPITTFGQFKDLVKIPKMEKYPLRFENQTGLVNVPDQYALVNRWNGATEGIVTKQYKVIQPDNRIEQLFGITQSLGYGCIAGGVQAGRVFAMFDTGGGHTQHVEGGSGNKDVLIAGFGYDGCHSDRYNMAGIRMACWNVIVYLLNQVSNGMKILHRGSNLEKKHDACLDAIMKGKEALKFVHKQFETLAEKPIVEKEAIQWVIDTLGVKDKIEESGKVPQQVYDIMTAFKHGKGEPAAKGTMLDLFHAATYVNNNHRGSRENRMYNNLVGNFVTENQKFLKSALNYEVKVA